MNLICKEKQLGTNFENKIIYHINDCIIFWETGKGVPNSYIVRLNFISLSSLIYTDDETYFNNMKLNYKICRNLTDCFILLKSNLVLRRNILFLNCYENHPSQPDALFFVIFFAVDLFDKWKW